MRTRLNMPEIRSSPTLVGRRPRRANDTTNSPGADRAGFEPRRGRDLTPDLARIETLASKQSSMNANATQRLKSGAESRLEIAAILGAPRFSPYQRRAPISRRTGTVHLT